mmetsp:Transcript_72261/g.202819  ORF Transcript_72261/g.202819 Transcript_72261/m.202819 type:complete len:438 (-) Transcript_72261:350-1663(-)
MRRVLSAAAHARAGLGGPLPGVSGQQRQHDEPRRRREVARVRLRELHGTDVGLRSAVLRRRVRVCRHHRCGKRVRHPRACGLDVCLRSSGGRSLPQRLDGSMARSGLQRQGGPHALGGHGRSVVVLSRPDPRRARRVGCADWLREGSAGDRQRLLQARAAAGRELHPTSDVPGQLESAGDGLGRPGWRGHPGARVRLDGRGPGVQRLRRRLRHPHAQLQRVGRGGPGLLGVLAVESLVAGALCGLGWGCERRQRARHHGLAQLVPSGRDRRDGRQGRARGLGAVEAGGDAARVDARRVLGEVSGLRRRPDCLGRGRHQERRRQGSRAGRRVPPRRGRRSVRRGQHDRCGERLRHPRPRGEELRRRRGGRRPLLEQDSAGDRSVVGGGVRGAGRQGGRHHHAHRDGRVQRPGPDVRRARLHRRPDRLPPDRQHRHHPH